MEWGEVCLCGVGGQQRGLALYKPTPSLEGRAPRRPAAGCALGLSGSGGEASPGRPASRSVRLWREAGVQAIVPQQDAHRR